MNQLLEFNNLIFQDGIWFADIKTEISYPTDGNNSCFQIEEESFWFKHRNNCILSVLNKYSQDKEIIDIGGGNGFVSSFLQKNNYNPILIEPGISGCINAKSRGLNNIICSSFQDIKIKNNIISNVGIFDVLEHLENDNGFLKDIYSKLKIGGKLFITVPAYNFLWSYEDENAGHFRRYTLKKIKKLLVNTGFKIDYSTYFFAPLFLPIFVFRTLPFLFRKKIDKKHGKTKKEHSQSKFNSILQKLWAWELRKINKNKKIKIGSSCLLVVSKI
jgi:SAM-dependent methyltransferase